MTGTPGLSLDTLLLLQRCLDAQQMVVSDPEFEATALAVIRAKRELAEAIAAAQAADDRRG